MAYHICMVVTTDFWNDRRVFKEASSALSFGYKVSIVCTSRPEDKIFASSEYQKQKLDAFGHNFQVKAVKLGERKYRDIPILSTIYAFLWILYGWAKIFIVLCKIKPDLYHFHDIDALGIGFIPAKFKKKPIVFDCHDIFSEIQFKGSILFKMKFIWKYLEKILSNKADAVFTIADSVKNYLSISCGVSPDKITKIYNAPALHPIKKSNLIREKHNIKEDTYIILYLGSVNPDRGLETLFKSAKLFNSNLVLAIYGFGHEDTWTQLKKLACNYGVEKKLIFGRSLEANEVSDYLMSADFLTIPNLLLSPAYNVLPNKFFECMMAGKPFVCNELPEMASLVRSYDCGIVCNNNSPETYAKALNDLSKMPERAKELGENGRRIAENLHNWEVQSKKINEVYINLLGCK